VYNLSFDVKSEALMKHMSKAGTVVSADININKRNKKSKGTAVVTYESSKDAMEAIGMLFGSTLYGREVSCAVH
jgi:RNA recognition motif-containing protein